MLKLQRYSALRLAALGCEPNIARPPLNFHGLDVNISEAKPLLAFMRSYQTKQALAVLVDCWRETHGHVLRFMRRGY